MNNDAGVLHKEIFSILDDAIRRIHKLLINEENKDEFVLNKHVYLPYRAYDGDKFEDSSSLLSKEFIRLDIKCSLALACIHDEVPIVSPQSYVLIKDDYK